MLEEHLPDNYTWIYLSIAPISVFNREKKEKKKKKTKQGKSHDMHQITITQNFCIIITLAI